MGIHRDLEDNWLLAVRRLVAGPSYSITRYRLVL